MREGVDTHKTTLVVVTFTSVTKKLLPTMRCEFTHIFTLQWTDLDNWELLVGAQHIYDRPPTARSLGEREGGGERAIEMSQISLGAARTSPILSLPLPCLNLPLR